MTEEELQQLTDDDLYDLMLATRSEMIRRRDLTSVLDANPALTDAHMQSIGREFGTEYKAPSGAHEAYPLGWEVVYDGKTWTATRNGAHEVPGNSPDWRQVADPDEILPWEQPHAGSEYPVGALVTHLGYVWRNDHIAPNGWEPGANGSQWTNLGTISDYNQGEE